MTERYIEVCRERCEPCNWCRDISLKDAIAGPRCTCGEWNFPHHHGIREHSSRRCIAPPPPSYDEYVRELEQAPANPTPAPTEDARWLSPEQRENIPHMRTDNARDIEIDVRLLLKHAAYMDERLKQAEAAHRKETRSYEAYIAKLNHDIAAKDREIAELRKFEELAYCLDALTGAAPVHAAATEPDRMAEVITQRVTELRRDRERFVEAGAGLIALAEKMFGMLRESAKRGFSRMSPEGVTFEDLRYVQRMRSAIAKAQGAATPVQRETDAASGINAAMKETNAEPTA